MLEIQRTTYLEKLLRYVEAPVAVAVVGLRRIGKSVLLRQLACRLKERGTVVYIDMEDLSFSTIGKSDDLVNFVRDQQGVHLPAQQDTPVYVIVDEIQHIEGWERAVASLQNRNNVHVVVSGSNSTLLAGELATRLAGRYITLRMLPFSLGEFAELYEATREPATPAELFPLYRKLGGLPGLLHTDLSEDLVRQMLRDIYSTIAMRDIVNRRSIRDVDTFESVVRFAMDNVGNLTSAKRISDFMKAQRRAGTTDTVLNYLAYLCEAFVLDRVDRFDLRGKRHLQINSKYYLGDIGLRQGLLGIQDRWIAGDLENLVYHELLRRDYQVSIGIADAREIDFVAESAAGRIYLQVSYLLDSPETLERESSALLASNDAYPKMIVSMDEASPGDLKGITHVNAVRFLAGAPLPDQAPDR